MHNRDLLWKGIIEDLFPHFLSFFFPAYADQIDFSRGFEFKDKELAELFPQSKNTRRYADLLVKVWLKTGEERFFYIHIEVQGYHDKHFAARMYTYFYRISEKCGQPVTALAIFTDESKSWHPQVYEYEFMGTSLTYRFNTYKLATADSRALANDPNIFAIVMEAALLALRKGDEENLLKNKVALVRKLYARQISEGDYPHPFYLYQNICRVCQTGNPAYF